MLTSAQLTTLKAEILADPALQAYFPESRYDLIAEYYKEPTTTYCWRTSVSRAEIYNLTSREGTNWSWTFYKNQNAVEQNAWVQMFMGDQADFSQANLRAGIAQIFTAASSANATHALAIGKRLANRGEKLFAVGVGTLQSPAVFKYEGEISVNDIASVLN